MQNSKLVTTQVLKYNDTIKDWVGYDIEAVRLHTPGYILIDLQSDKRKKYSKGGNIFPGIRGVLPENHGGTGVTNFSEIVDNLKLQVTERTEDLEDGIDKQYDFIQQDELIASIPIKDTDQIQVTLQTVLTRLDDLETRVAALEGGA